MADKLAKLCASSFKEKHYLLLFDDFEQNLEGAEKGQPEGLMPETAQLLYVLLHYLPFSGKKTQLLITSRYRFSLTDQDRDLVSERLVKDDLYTSIHIDEFEIGARDTKLGREEITRDIPNVGEEALRNLDEEGIVRIGAEVLPGDILAHRSSGRRLRGPHSHRCPAGHPGGHRPDRVRGGGGR